MIAALLVALSLTPAIRSHFERGSVPPYTAGHLERLLADARRSPDVTTSEAGRTPGGRAIPLVTVTNRDRPEANKKVIWIMARQHAWESGTSWVLDGALRHMLTPRGAPLRDAFIFRFVPIADPDGVARGDVGFDAIADPKRTPEIAGLRKAVLDWMDSGRRIDLFLSLRNAHDDSLEGPLSKAGPDYRDMIQRFAGLLAKDTIFHSEAPRDWAPGDPAPGHMDACEALFHERGIPTLRLEQDVQRGSGIDGYRHFGVQLVTALAGAVAGRVRSENLLPPVNSSAWKLWSPRDELRPRTAVENGMVSLVSTGAAANGKWQAVTPVQAGRSYRFEVRYRPVNIRSEAVSVPVILTWSSDEAGRAMVQRDFVETVATAGQWRTAARTLEAPAGARSLQVELGLRWTENGSVFWKDALLEEVEPRPHRIVRVVTTHLAQAGGTVEANLALMSKAFDEAGAKKPDIVLFSETLVDRGVPGSPERTAQTIPGPATDMLARKAKQYSTYVATSLHERDGGLIYNTVVLIDRQGRIAGKYRKTHLAMIEGESGITPGDDYQVFATDFGKVGILTCWDNWFSEPARIMRLKGAELLLLPIAGDGDASHWDAVSKARAMDNGLYFASSSTVGQSASRIIDPAGKVLAETMDRFGIVAADIDLDQERRLRWLSVGPGNGEARSLYIHERRPDTYGVLSGK